MKTAVVSFTKWAMLPLLAAWMVAGQPSWAALNANVEGQAKIVEITNTATPIVIGETGFLSSLTKGTNLILGPTNFATILLFDGARASTHAANRQVFSAALITNFTLIFTPPGKPSHRLSFDFLRVRVSAACVFTGVVLRSVFELEGLRLDETPIEVTGKTNQVIGFDGGVLVLNDRSRESTRDTGFISVAGIFLSLDNDASGPIGLAEAVIECLRPVPPFCERTFGSGLIVDRARGKLAQFEFTATQRQGQKTGQLFFRDFVDRFQITSTTVTGYEVLPDGRRRITYAIIDSGRPGTATLTVANNRQLRRGLDAITVSITPRNYTASSTVQRGNIQVQGCR